LAVYKAVISVLLFRVDIDDVQPDYPERVSAEQMLRSKLLRFLTGNFVICFRAWARKHTRRFATVPSPPFDRSHMGKKHSKKTKYMPACIFKPLYLPGRHTLLFARNTFWEILS
jgi:hypothetical protein